MRKMLNRLLAPMIDMGRGSEMDADIASTPKRKRVVPLWRCPQSIAMAALTSIVLTGTVGTWAWKSGQVETLLNHAKLTVIKVSSDLGFTV